jgi:hypothetical protein
MDGRVNEVNVHAIADDPATHYHLSYLHASDEKRDYSWQTEDGCKRVCGCTLFSTNPPLQAVIVALPKLRTT